MPAVTDCEAGETLSVKPATVRVRVVERITGPLLVPVTVTVKLPAGVVARVVRVNVDIVVPGGVTGLGEKLQIAPAGNVLASQPRVTELAKPPVALMVTVYVAAEPATTDWEGGERESEKSGAVPPPPEEVTVRAAVVLWFSAPLVPVTVKVTVPTGVLARVLRVSVAVPGVGAGGEKLQLAPAGNPVHDAAEKLTIPLKPF